MMQKYGKTKLPWFSRFLQYLVRIWDGLILQHFELTCPHTDTINSWNTV